MATLPDAGVPLQVSLPARSEWEWVARRLLLSYAHSLGMDSLRLEELGVFIGRVWDEVALAPGVEQATIRLSAPDVRLQVVVEGSGTSDDGGPPEEPEGGTWSSPLTTTLVAHLTRNATITRGHDRLLIEASFDREPAS